MSQGSDKNGRQAVLIEAVRKRRMGLEAAVSLLPPDQAQGLLMSLGVKKHPLLAAPSKEGQKQVRALLAQLRLGQPKDAA